MCLTLRSNLSVVAGQNNRGVYMRISEVKTNFRTAITIPEKSWSRFRDILADYCDKIKQPSSSSTTSTGGLGGGGGGGGPQGGSSDQPHTLVSFRRRWICRFLRC